MTEKDADQAVFVILATTAPLLSGLIPLLCLQASQGRFFRWMLALSAGLLLGIGTLDLIPEALQLALSTHKEHLTTDSHQVSHNNIDSMARLGINQINHHLSASTLGPVERLFRITKMHLDRLSWVSLKQRNSINEEHAALGEHNHEHEHEHDHHGDVSDISNVMVGIFVGYMVLLTLEKLFMGHHSHGSSKRSGSDDECDDHIDHKKGPAASSSGFSYTVFLAFIVHSFADGFLISGGFESSHGTGTRVALAVVSHKFPDGFVLASVVGTRTNVSKKMGLLMIVGVSFMTPLGTMIGHFLLRDVSPSTLGFILAYGAGNFLYISLTAIIPEVMEIRQHHASSIMLIVMGYVLVWGSSAILGHAH